MTKKKKTQEGNKNEINDLDSVCTHMQQSINIAHLRRGLRDFSKHGECQKCDSGKTEESPCIYVCLQCGHQGCDRSTEHKHALQHFRMARSHMCAMNADNFKIWCYKCDDFKTSSLKIVQECSDLIHRLFTPESETEVIDVAKSEELHCEGTKGSTMPVNLDQFSKIKGLSNLGNTCFFNSIMQSINQTHLFGKHLKSKDNAEVMLNIYSKDGEEEEGDDEHSRDVVEEMPIFKKTSLKVKLSASTGLTKSLLSFYEEMKPQNKKSTVISPGALFGSVCAKAPQFRGFQQQDSHELLRHLLDGVKEEEIKKLQAGVLDAYGVNKNDKNSLTDFKKKQIKAFGKSAKHTSTDEVFGGCFLSTVTCDECHNPHQVYESFLDISLPICSNKFIEESLDGNDKPVGKMYKKNVEKEEKSKHLSKKERINSKKLKKQGSKKNKTLSLSKFNEMQEGGKDEDGEEGDKEGDEEEGEEPAERDLAEEVVSMNLIGGEENCPDVDSSHALINGHACADDEDVGPIANNTENYRNLASPSTEEVGEHDSDEDYNYSYQSMYEMRLQAMKMAMLPLGKRDEQVSFTSSSSVSSCLYQYTSPDLLFGSNKYLCNYCNKKCKGGKSPIYTVARRQVLIFAPPAILTLHLKRFQQTLASFRKLNDHVDFTELLDLAPHCSCLAQNVGTGQDKVLYALYAVVEHSGSMRGGHYTAYVKIREENKQSKKFLQTLSRENFSSGLLVQLLQERQKQLHQSTNQKCPTTSNGRSAPPPGRWFHISDSHVSEVKDVSNVLRCQAYILFYERIL